MKKHPHRFFATTVLLLLSFGINSVTGFAKPSAEAYALAARHHAHSRKTSAELFDDISRDLRDYEKSKNGEALTRNLKLKIKFDLKQIKFLEDALALSKNENLHVFVRGQIRDDLNAFKSGAINFNKLKKRVEPLLKTQPKTTSAPLSILETAKLAIDGKYGVFKAQERDMMETIIRLARQKVYSESERDQRLALYLNLKPTESTKPKASPKKETPATKATSDRAPLIDRLRAAEARGSLLIGTEGSRLRKIIAAFSSGDAGAETTERKFRDLLGNVPEFDDLFSEESSTTAKEPKDATILSDSPKTSKKSKKDDEKEEKNPRLKRNKQEAEDERKERTERSLEARLFREKMMDKDAMRKQMDILTGLAKLPSGKIIGDRYKDVNRVEVRRYLVDLLRSYGYDPKFEAKDQEYSSSSFDSDSDSPFFDFDSESFDSPVKKKKKKPAKKKEAKSADDNLSPFERDINKYLCNIIVEIPGTKAPEEIVEINAHYDTQGVGVPGADDNGSGLTTLIEMARIFSGTRPEKTVRLIFADLEERGLKGTTHHVELAKERKDNIVAAFVMDMFGYYPKKDKVAPHYVVEAGVPDKHDRNGSYLKTVDLANLFYYQVSRFTDRFAKAEVLTHDAEPHSADHGPYWDAGFPCLLVAAKYEDQYVTPGYHSPDDTVKLVNFPFYYEVASHLIEAATHVAGIRLDPKMTKAVGNRATALLTLSDAKADPLKDEAARVDKESKPSSSWGSSGSFWGSSGSSSGSSWSPFSGAGHYPSGGGYMGGSMSSRFGADLDDAGYWGKPTSLPKDDGENYRPPSKPAPSKVRAPEPAQDLAPDGHPFVEHQSWYKEIPGTTVTRPGIMYSVDAKLPTGKVVPHYLVANSSAATSQSEFNRFLQDTIELIYDAKKHWVSLRVGRNIYNLMTSTLEKAKYTIDTREQPGVAGYVFATPATSDLSARVDAALKKAFASEKPLGKSEEVVALLESEFSIRFGATPKTLLAIGRTLSEGNPDGTPPIAVMDYSR